MLEPKTFSIYNYKLNTLWIGPNTTPDLLSNGVAQTGIVGLKDQPLVVLVSNFRDVQLVYRYVVLPQDIHQLLDVFVGKSVDARKT